MAQLVPDRYSNLRPLATGSRSEVVLARDAVLKRDVAIKLLRPEFAPDAAAGVRLAQALAPVLALDHPNIVPAFDWGWNGRFFLTLEYLPGGTLADRLAQIRLGGARFSPDELARLVKRIAAPIDYAHRRGLIHGRLDPSSVYFAADGNPVLANFERAVLDGVSGGRLSGDAEYQSPEAAAGQTPGVADDLYSLAAIIYALATGSPPPRTSMPDSIEGLPGEMGAVLRRALGSREKRFGSAGEFSRALSAAVPPEGDAVVGQGDGVTGRAGGTETGRRGDPETRNPVSARNRASEGGDAGRPFDAERTVLHAPIRVPDSSQQETIIRTEPAAEKANAETMTRADRPTENADSETIIRAGNAPPASPEPARTAQAKTIVEPPIPRVHKQRHLPRPFWLALAAVVLLGLAGAVVANALSTPSLWDRVTSMGATKPADASGPAAVERIGVLHFSDSSAPVDQVALDVSNLPAPKTGSEYDVWLVAGNGERENIGTLEPDAGGRAQLAFVDPGAANLLDAFDRIEVRETAVDALDAGPIIFAGSLPAGALMHIRHLLVGYDDTPKNIGLAIGLRRAGELVRQTAVDMQDAQNRGDLERVRIDAEALVNVIEGRDGADYGDLNKDGSVTDPGDGYGLLLNGKKLGYIEGVFDHANLSGASPDATEAIRTNADRVKTTTQNIEDWAKQLRDAALQVLKSQNSEDAAKSVQQASTLADQVLNGVDQNRDGRVDPIAGEGGILTAYQYSLMMADIPLAASNP